ncbi:MAG: PepSY-associated TM helix domain-containing protein, partial [Pseudoalteromonas distincta]
MKDSFFRSMTWLHTWVGLLVCWLLYLIFFAGTLSFFRDEITLWNQPA